MVKQTVNAFGALHIAVNNAGVGSEFSKVSDVKIEDWQRVIDINLNGVFYGMKYQIPEMLKENNGSIIIIASILGQAAFQGSSAYVASKHAVIGLTKTGAIDYATDGVRVNAIGPGFIYTGLVNEQIMGIETINLLEIKHPMNRLGEPHQIAALVIFLASDEASFLTGSFYPVDGGYLAV